MKIGKGLAVRGAAHNLSNPADFPTGLSSLESEANLSMRIHLAKSKPAMAWGHVVRR
jgi:phosphoenolpyruvate carboxylase